MKYPIISFILLTIVVAFLSTLAFLGMGYVISSFVQISVFHATILSMVSIFVVAVIVCSFLVAGYVLTVSSEYVRERIQAEEDVDNDKDEIDDLENEKVVPIKKVGRNTLCPCGSGNKFKNCCGE